MKKVQCLIFALFFCGFLACAEIGKMADGTWTDPERALAEHPGFRIQGEYVGEKDGGKKGVQIAALKEKKFLVLTYPGGLPNEGWDQGPLVSQVMDEKEVTALTATLKKLDRVSPTLGQKASPEAIVFFDGEATSHIKGEVKDGLLWAGSETTTPLQDFQLHLEFRHPFKPERDPSSQDRGNSGIYIFNNYEIQVLDSFGLDFNMENNAIKLSSDSKQWCGSFYKFRTPDVPMCLPPLTWQTYDIDFRAPRFENGEKTANAIITVRHNGVLIHDKVEMPKGTGAGGSRPERPEGFIFLQGHGNPVAFRNFWAVKK